MADRPVIYEELAKQHNIDPKGVALAQLLDAQDPLASFREKFLIPPSRSGNGN